MDLKRIHEDGFDVLSGSISSARKAKEMMMPLYMVRRMESEAMLGFFSADRLEELYWLVEEFADPALCEYALMLNGGIVYPGKDGSRLPQVSSEDWRSLNETDLNRICDVALTQRPVWRPAFTRGLAEDIRHGDELAWAPLAEAGEAALRFVLDACVAAA